MVTFAFLLGLPMLKSAVAFSAVVSISTIGLYISYAIPVLLRITTARKEFVKGAFHLGFMSYPIAIIVIVWVAFITVSAAHNRKHCKSSKSWLAILRRTVTHDAS